MLCFAAVRNGFDLRVAAFGKAFPFLSLAFLFHFHFPFCSSQFATFASDRSCLCLRRAVAKCSFPLCGAMPQRVARSFRCCKHLERCRKGAGGSRVVPSPPPRPLVYCVARQKFKVQSEHFRFSPLINVSKLAPQLHLPQQLRLRLLVQLLPHPAWPGVEFIDSQSTPAAFDLFASSIHLLWQPAPLLISPLSRVPSLLSLVPAPCKTFTIFTPFSVASLGGRNLINNI